MSELSKKKYFDYDNKELLGIMGFDLYDRVSIINGM